MNRSETPLTKEKFENIVNRCMEALKEHGFTPQFKPRTDPVFNEIFLNCLVWFYNEMAMQKNVEQPKKKTNLSQKKLDHMTLECALIFVTEGVKDVHYNESLNCIRILIIELLEAMGFEKPNNLCNSQNWTSYGLWEELKKLEENLSV